MSRSTTRRWAAAAAAAALAIIAGGVAWVVLGPAPRSPDAEALAAASGVCAAEDQVGGCETARLLFLAGDDGARSNARDAVTRLQTGCAAGRLRACAALATALQQGFGVAAEPARALELAQRACAGGVGQGCHVAGTVLRARGTPAERVRALEAFAWGCLRDHAASCSDLAGEDLAAAPPVPRLSALVERVRRHEPLAALDLIRADLRVLRILRNTVFAAHGHRFTSSDLRAFFSAHEWYAPARAAVDDATLLEADRRNLALVKAAGASTAVPRSHAGGETLLLEAMLETDHVAAPLTDEERALVGSWTQLTGSPAESIRLPQGHFSLLPSRMLLWRVEDCTGLVAARVGTWSAHPGELRVRWLAELRRTRGSMEEEDQSCTGGAGTPAELFPLVQEEVVPVSPLDGEQPAGRRFRGFFFDGPYER